MTPKGGVKSIHSSYGGITVSCQWFCMVLASMWLFTTAIAMCGLLSLMAMVITWMMRFW